MFKKSSIITLLNFVYLVLVQHQVVNMLPQAHKLKFQDGEKI